MFFDLADTLNISVQRAIKALDKGHDVVAVYDDHNNFMGRYIVTDITRPHLEYIASLDEYKVLDWATGEYADL